MDEHVAVITGTTHGIGRVTAFALARAGRSQVMLCRDVPAGEGVAAAIHAEVPGARVAVLPCDLASLASVDAAAERLRRDFPPIDLLINNAGRVCMRRMQSADGYELCFATNHLGPFHLTQRLLDRMARPGRIVFVASRAHSKGHFDPSSVTALAGRYRPALAYAQSKLANIQYCFALARRLEGSGVTANCLHPGVVASNLLPRWLRLIKPLISHVIDETEGARTTIHLALSPEVAAVNGRYFDEHRQIVEPTAAATDRAVQEQLWQLSEDWVARALARSGAQPR